MILPLTERLPVGAGRKSQRFSSPRLLTGFTLIELMVALAIIVVILGIALTSQSTFNRTLVLANTAYDLGLTARYTETYGIGTRVTTANTNAGYGLHFDTTTSRSSFLMYSDTSPASGGACHTSPSTIAGAPDAVPGDCAYTAGADALVSTFNLNNGITVSGLCADDGAGWNCGSSFSPLAIDVTFARPNPVAYFAVNGIYDPSAQRVCIVLASPSGMNRYVTIGKTGVINADAASCP